MPENKFEKEKQEMIEAEAHLIKVAESLPMTSTVLKKKPAELREAIKNYYEASAKYVKCLESLYKNDGEELGEYFQIL